MICDCCGRKKKLFESFAAVQYKKVQLHFCADCNDLAYKVRDDANDQNKEGYDKHINEWKRCAKKPSNLFLEWQQEYLAAVDNLIKEGEI